MGVVIRVNTHHALLPCHGNATSTPTAQGRENREEGRENKLQSGET